jgi:hypothetical protein
LQFLHFLHPESGEETAALVVSFVFDRALLQFPKDLVLKVRTFKFVENVDEQPMSLNAEEALMWRMYLQYLKKQNDVREKGEREKVRKLERFIHPASVP